MSPHPGVTRLRKRCHFARTRREEFALSTPFMIQSANGVLAIDVSDAAYAEGTSILGYYLPGGEGTPILPNQSWLPVPDPLNSGHYLIVSGACDLCLGIGVNVPSGADATDDATDRGAVLTLQAQEPVNNHYQLWDFVPPTNGAANVAFIQNPQTGYVIELQSRSTEAGPLVVNPRRISNDSYQLWTGVYQDGTAVTLPVVAMVSRDGAPLHGFWQYILVPPDQADHLVGITITIDIIEDVVVDAFSLQINCDTPYLGPDGVDTEDYDRDAQWMQFGLFMQDNQLTLFTQIYHRPGPVDASEFTSETETSAPLLNLIDSTIPAGTRIIMNLCTDQDDFVIGIAGIALDITGLPIGTPIYWPALGRDTYHTKIDGGKVHQKAMAPVGALTVVFCDNPNVQDSSAIFTAGMGTITVTASPGISAQNSAPDPAAPATAENSDMPYDLVPVGTARLIAQPFGLPVSPVVPPVHPKFGDDGGYRTVIIEEPGGIVEILPGDLPGPVIVFDDNPASPGDDDRGRTAG
jgi:hypothetical protein